MAKPRNPQALHVPTNPLLSKSAARVTAEQHPALHVEVASSLLYPAASSLLHVTAAWAVIISGISVPASMATIGLIVVSLLYSLCSARRGYLVIWHANGLLEISPATDGGIRSYSDGTQTGRLTGKTFHSCLLVILVLRFEDGRLHRCVIPKDSVPVASYRRIRSRLQLLAPDQLVR